MFNGKLNFKKYLQIIKTTFKEATAYRLDALMTLGSSIVFLVLYYYVWYAIDQSGTLTGGFQQVITYIVAGQIVSNAAFLQTEIFMGERVRRGTIVNELKRPIELMKYTYFHELAWSLFNFSFKSIPVAIIGVVIFGINTPTLFNAIFFLISTFLAFNVVFLLAYSSAMLVFWTKVDWSVRMMRNTVQNLFSGVLFPLYLLPDTLGTIFNWLPFQVMADAPIQIFTMSATGTDILIILLKQIVWIVILYGVAILAWKKAKTKLTVQGG